MKIIGTIFLLFMSNLVVAQLIPFAGLEINKGSNITLESLEDRTAISYDTGDLALTYGIGYSWNKFDFRTKAKTSMYLDKLASYTPSHTEFTVAVSYQIQTINIKVEHACYHPLQTFKDNPVKIFGGYTKLGVYWNYKP